MTTKIFALAAGAAGLGLAASASAQIETPELTPTNLAVRAGVVLPLDSSLSDVGSTLIGLGIDYQLTRPLLPNGVTYFSLDYFTKNLRFERGSITPICLNHRWYTGNHGMGRRTYVFAGLGVAIIDIQSSNTVIAARGGLGAELGDAIFFEAAAVLSDRGAVARANSVGFYIGYRF